MATAKKPVKKTASKAKVTAKKRAPKKVAKLQSFRRSADTSPFISFKITKQTVYWSILLIFILILALWILNIQIDILEITNSIDQAMQ